MQDELVIEPSEADDPGKARLSRVLEAQLAIERAYSFRVLLVHLLGALSVPLWFSAVFPRWVPEGPLFLVLALWALCMTGAFLALISEGRLYRQRTELLEEMGSRPQSRSRRR